MKPLEYCIALNMFSCRHRFDFYTNNGETNSFRPIIEPQSHRVYTIGNLMPRIDKSSHALGSCVQNVRRTGKKIILVSREKKIIAALLAQVK